MTRHGEPVEAARTVAPPGSPESAFPAAAPVPEAEWAAWAETLDPLVIDPCGSVVVVAPHPDDETLGCGGLLHDLALRGTEVRVITVTNGEGSHSGWADLASVRREEQRSALHALGLPSSALLLAIPDGCVAEYEHDLEAILAEQICGASVIVAPWAADGHTDHDAVGRVAARLASTPGPVVLAHPVWAWQWARCDDLAGLRWQRWALSPSACRAKHDAMAAYRSQITDQHGPAVLGPEARTRAARPYEVYARVG